jgi:hypothetical protein
VFEDEYKNTARSLLLFYNDFGEEWKQKNSDAMVWVVSRVSDFHPKLQITAQSKDFPSNYFKRVEGKEFSFAGRSLYKEGDECATLIT